MRLSVFYCKRVVIVSFGSARRHTGVLAEGGKRFQKNHAKKSLVRLEFVRIKACFKIDN